MMKINECYLYLLVWIIQLIHDPLHLYGDSVSVLVLFGLYAWSLYYCYLTISRYKLPQFLKLWSILFFLFSIYAFVRILNPFGYSYNVGFEVNSRMYLMEHWTSMLPIYPIFVYSKKGLLTEETLKKVAIIFIVLAIICFYYGRTLAIAKIDRIDNEAFITNNMGYFVAMVMPLMYFWRKKPMIQYIGLAVLMVFVLLAVKRGAIIVGMVCIIIQILHRQNKVMVSWSSFAILSFIIVGYYYIINLLSTNDYFLFRLERTMEGDDSTRGELYSDLFKAFIESDNPFYILFGRGADGTILLLKTQAHNDWLEIMIDMGIIGIIIFFLFWIRAFTDYIKIVDKDIKVLFFMVIIMLLIRTFFSMSINDMYLSTNIILGYCMANINKDFKKVI